jgi:hypothetical protein
MWERDGKRWKERVTEQKDGEREHRKGGEGGEGRERVKNK